MDFVDLNEVVIPPNIVELVPESVARAYRHIAPMLDGLGAVLGALDVQDRAVIEAFLGKVIEVYRNTLPGSTASQWSMRLR